jgi:hypothetical protein
MSFGVGEPRSFLEPLTGKTTTFLLDSRRDNIAFARTVAVLAAGHGDACAILDLDALYSSNAAAILSPLSGGATSIIVPAPGSEIERETTRLFLVPQRVILVDSLNTLYHLLAFEDESSRGRRLSFFLACLTYLARTNNKAVIFTMYRREGFRKVKPGLSISGLGDTTASVRNEDGHLTMRIERGSAWPGGSFSIRIPSERPYLSR